MRVATTRLAQIPSETRTALSSILIVGAGVTGVAFLNALNLASRLAQTSDSAQGFVAGHAVARGNALLAGWHFPFNDYYFTDTIPYAVLEWLVGPQPFLLVLVPALAYAAVVSVGLVHCLRRTQTLAQNVDAAAMLGLLLAAPMWIGTWNPLLMSDMHVGTVLCGLIALGQCANLARNGQRSAWVVVCKCAALIATTAATVASDPFCLVFAFGPAVALLFADAILCPTIRNGRLVLPALFAGIALGFLLPTLIAGLGGFTTERDVLTGFVGTPGLPRNLAALALGILSLFGANPLAPNRGFDSLPSLAIHGIGLALAVGAVARVSRRLFSPHRASLFDRMLWAGILAVLAACALSAQFGKGLTQVTSWTGGPPMRYLTPVFVFAATLSGRRLAGGWDISARPLAGATRGVLVLLATSNLFAGLRSIDAQPPWISNNPPTIVARWLESRGLTQGVGEYWTANLLTAMSGDRVQVRSVLPLDGKLAAYVWSSDAEAYARPPQFVIWRDDNPTGMHFADVRATYSVCRTAFVDGYRIATLATACGAPPARLSKARSRSIPSAADPA